jgi:hypothetical protein
MRARAGDGERRRLLRAGDWIRAHSRRVFNFFFLPLLLLPLSDFVSLQKETTTRDESAPTARDQEQQSI